MLWNLKDKGQNVRKKNPDGTVNIAWLKIHRPWKLNKRPRNATDCGQDHPNHLRDIL